MITKQVRHQKRHKKLKSRSQKAFQKWLNASNDWVSARHHAQQNGKMKNTHTNSRVQEMEKRIDDAADAFETARKALQRVKKESLN
jgi:hypothetical protein